MSKGKLISKILSKSGKYLSKVPKKVIKGISRGLVNALPLGLSKLFSDKNEKEQLSDYNNHEQVEIRDKSNFDNLNNKLENTKEELSDKLREVDYRINTNKNDQIKLESRINDEYKSLVDLDGERLSIADRLKNITNEISKSYKSTKINTLETTKSIIDDNKNKSLDRINSLTNEVSSIKSHTDELLSLIEEGNNTINNSPKNLSGTRNIDSKLVLQIQELIEERNRLLNRELELSAKIDSARLRFTDYNNQSLKLDTKINELSHDKSTINNKVDSIDNKLIENSDDYRTSPTGRLTKIANKAGLATSLLMSLPTMIAGALSHNEELKHQELESLESEDNTIKEIEESDVLDHDPKYVKGSSNLSEIGKSQSYQVIEELQSKADNATDKESYVEAQLAKYSEHYMSQEVDGFNMSKSSDVFNLVNKLVKSNESLKSEAYSIFNSDKTTSFRFLTSKYLAELAKNDKDLLRLRNQAISSYRLKDNGVQYIENLKQVLFQLRKSEIKSKIEASFNQDKADLNAYKLKKSQNPTYINKELEDKFTRLGFDTSNIVNLVDNSPTSKDKLRITSPIGPRTINGQPGLHGGVDISTGGKSGGKVRALRKHRVVSVNYNTSTQGGYVLVEDYDNPNNRWRYYHIVPKLGLKYGSIVEAGEDLGVIDDKKLYDPHLHLEYYSTEQNKWAQPNMVPTANYSGDHNKYKYANPVKELKSIGYDLESSESRGLREDIGSGDEVTDKMNEINKKMEYLEALIKLDVSINSKKPPIINPVVEIRENKQYINNLSSTRR